MPTLSQRAKAGAKGTANTGADARRKKTTKKRGKRSAAAVSDAAAHGNAGGDAGGRIFAESPRMLLHRVRLGLGTSIDLHTAVIAIVEMMRDRLIRLSEQASPPAPRE